MDVADDNGAEGPGNDLVFLFSNRDTGVGILSDKLAAVFNGFTQLIDAGTIKPGSNLLV